MSRAGWGSTPRPFGGGSADLRSTGASVPGITTEEQAEIRRLKKENAELRRANEILKAASAFFAAELDRPTTR